ncbi:unnamed protein product [Cuscuta epithymum]|uniref:Uncharacterized protein n=2 Tax=Cuscuta epithymum TaxID=186058 RepID=A0AAV0FE91_9ASTE|nr:unnamed protein product [Cuscuta epithymum]
MDDSRLFAAGLDDEPPTSPPKQQRKTKTKRLRKADQGASSQSAPPVPEQSEPVRDVEPVQQVAPEQHTHADTLMDQLFSDQQSHHFSAEEVAAHEADLASQFERISLYDPAHEMLERGGCPASQIWSTSGFLNGHNLPPIPVEEIEECIALTVLKAGIYSLKLKETRQAKEQGLLMAKETAEQAAEAERRAFAEERKKLEAEAGELRVKVGALQAKIAAAEAAQIKFSEAPPQIPDGPAEMTVDLSAVRDSFKASEEFLALKEKYATEQLPAVFGRHLEKMAGEERQKEGIRVLDQHPVTKEWADILARGIYSSGCQHMLQPLLPLLEKYMGRAVQTSDFPSDLHPGHLNALMAQMKKCRRALGMEVVQIVDEEADEDDDEDDKDHPEQ